MPDMADLLAQLQASYADEVVPCDPCFADLRIEAVYHYTMGMLSAVGVIEGAGLLAPAALVSTGELRTAILAYAATEPMEEATRVKAQCVRDRISRVRPQ